MRIAITGGTRFVGRHLADRLRADGHATPFTNEIIRRGLPHPGGFGPADLRCAPGALPLEPRARGPAGTPLPVRHDPQSHAGRLILRLLHAPCAFGELGG